MLKAINDNLYATNPATWQIREHAGGHDLVVMGSHGRRGFRRFALGSVAEKTIHHAPCSVYIARATPKSEESKEKEIA